MANDFCNGSVFIDVDLLWNNSWPQFTPCFQNTALILVPCGWLWITSLFLFCYVPSYIEVSRVRISRIHITKAVLSALLSVLSVVVAIKHLMNHNHLGEASTKADVVSPFIRAATMLYSIGVMHARRRSGMPTSGVIFTYWLLELLTGIIPFYSKITQQEYERYIFEFAIFYIDYFLLLVQLLLNFWAEDNDPVYINEKLICPERLSSFPSYITFFWVTPLMCLGWKKPLEERDMWELECADRCDRVLPGFMRHWTKQLKKKDSDKEKKNRDRDHLTSHVDEVTEREVTEETPFLKHRDATKKEEPEGASSKQAIDNVPNPKASLLLAVLKTFWWDLFKAHICKLCADLITFAIPMLLQVLIRFIETSEDDEPVWHGYVFVLGIYISQLLVSFLTHQMWFRCVRVGMRIRTALTAALYRKALTLSTTSRSISTVGEIVNLMAVDSQRFQTVSTYVWVVWSAPLQITLSLILLYNVIGPPVFAGVAVFFLFIPVNIVVARFMQRFQFRMMKLKDQRIKLMNEILNGIKVLKLYAWEVPFQEKVEIIRKDEMANVTRMYIARAFTMCSMILSPYLVTLASFAVYIFTTPNHFLPADIAFTSINLFNTLRFSITIIPMVLTLIAQAWVSVKRINQFLCLDDHDPNNVHHNSSKDSPIVIENGTFLWNEKLGNCLKDVNIRIPEGKLVAVVGTVGCGKSSLISAILGDMEKRSGMVNVKGTIAYVPQEAWIQNATLQQNILFGKENVHKRYDQVIETCALQPDLAVLPGKDQTEIGEKGINLSGGQKQRVSLARAVYSDRDIYLLDDPLSAVDAHVGKHIFEKVIADTGMLKGKTRVLVTHGIHWLPKVDSIIVLSEGVVTETGSYEELMSHDGAFAQFLNTYLTEHQKEVDELDPDMKEIQSRIRERLVSMQSESATSSDEDGTRKRKRFAASPVSNIEDSAIPSSSKKRSSYGSASDLRHLSVSRPSSRQSQISVTDLPGSQEFQERQLLESEQSKEEDQTDKTRLIDEEETFTGAVSWRVYMVYLKAIGLWPVLAVTLSFSLYQASSMGGNIWLQQWTDNSYISSKSIPDNDTEKRHLNDVYLGVYGVWGVFQGAAIFAFCCAMAVGVIGGARKLHNKMLHSVLRAPMSFFDTTPMGRILNRFSKDTDMVDENLPNMISAFFAPALTVISALIIVAINIPIFLTVIVPLGVIYGFIQRFYVATSRQVRRVESKTRSPIFTHFTETLNGVSTIRAFEADERFIKINDDRVDFNQAYVLAGQAGTRWLGIVLEMLGDACVLVAGVLAVKQRGTMTGGMMGLALNYATQITVNLNGFVQALANMETDIVSVERMKEYTDLEPEADWFIPDKKPANSWPSTGEIDLSNYTTRYREGLDLILKGITVNIKGGEKVGVVGRTGAGKSSMTLALFRLIEAAGGQISVDDVMISEIGLHDLRTKLTILPQDPVLFSGSLRMNLDPFEEYADDDIWRVIEHAHLRPYVEGLPESLDHEVGEGGKNMSVGQRQLVCLARMLLRKTRILILDEATAAVDMETDELIQQTIREEFKDYTIISIAHRLNTIMDYDRVMVLDQGLVSEYDTPANLLQNKSGVFYSMAREAGLTSQT